jgi:hypothetical protein
MIQQELNEDNNDEEDIDCPICYEPGCDYITVCCKHKFHEKCIKMWYEKSPTCPLCRTCSIREFKIKYNFCDYILKIFNSHASLNFNISSYPSIILPYTKIKRMEIKKNKLHISIFNNNSIKIFKFHVYNDLFSCFEIMKNSILNEYSTINSFL